MSAAEIVRQRNIAKLEDELGVLLQTMRDLDVEDLFINPDGAVWYVTRGGGATPGEYTYTQDAVRDIINTVAAMNDTVVNADRPVLEAILPFGGWRFEGVIPPVSIAPTFSIRAKPSVVYTLDDYVRSGSMTERQAAALRSAILNRRNVLLVGGTGSGKTTLLNACLAEIAKLTPDDRLISIEDTAELQSTSPNYVALYATNVTMGKCLKTALRMRPKRIIVGEVRGKEALDLLTAWNTGHPGGLATVHADDAHRGLSRLEALARMATRAPQQRFIAATVNVVAFIAEDALAPSGRRLREIVRVSGYRAGQYLLEEL